MIAERAKTAPVQARRALPAWVETLTVQGWQCLRPAMLTLLLLIVWLGIADWCVCSDLEQDHGNCQIKVSCEPMLKSALYKLGSPGRLYLRCKVQNTGRDSITLCANDWQQLYRYVPVVSSIETKERCPASRFMRGLGRGTVPSRREPVAADFVVLHHDESVIFRWLVHMPTNEVAGVTGLTYLCTFVFDSTGTEFGFNAWTGVVESSVSVTYPPLKSTERTDEDGLVFPLVERKDGRLEENWRSKVVVTYPTP